MKKNSLIPLVTCITIVAVLAITGGFYYKNRTTPNMSMIAVNIVFGMSIPNGEEVSEIEWGKFVLTDVIPRFPQGFSVFDTQGFWQDTETHQTIVEPSKVILLILENTTLNHSKVRDIALAYKNKFSQQAVLIYSNDIFTDLISSPNFSANDD